MTSHNSFPVVNKAGNLIGLIPKNFIIVLLKHKNWYFNDVFDGEETLEDLERVVNLNDSEADNIVPDMTFNLQKQISMN